METRFLIVVDRTGTHMLPAYGGPVWGEWQRISVDMDDLPLPKTIPSLHIQCLDDYLAAVKNAYTRPIITMKDFIG